MKLFSTQLFTIPTATQKNMNRDTNQPETWMYFSQMCDGIFSPQAMDRNQKKFSNLF